jgi:hypothetical protein
MCRVFKLHCSGFYAWLNQPLSDLALEDSRLLNSLKPRILQAAPLMAAHGFIDIYVMMVRFVAYIALLKSCVIIM